MWPGARITRMVRRGFGSSAFSLRDCGVRAVGPTVLGGPFCQVLGDYLRRVNRRLVRLGVFGYRPLDPLAIVHEMIADVVQPRDELLNLEHHGTAKALYQRVEILYVPTAGRCT